MMRSQFKQRLFFLSMVVTIVVALFYLNRLGNQPVILLQLSESGTVDSSTAITLTAVTGRFPGASCQQGQDNAGGGDSETGPVNDSVWRCTLASKSDVKRVVRLGKTSACTVSGTAVLVFENARLKQIVCDLRPKMVSVLTERWDEVNGKHRMSADYANPKAREWNAAAGTFRIIEGYSSPDGEMPAQLIIDVRQKNNP